MTADLSPMGLPIHRRHPYTKMSIRPRRTPRTTRIRRRWPNRVLLNVFARLFAPRPGIAYVHIRAVEEALSLKNRRGWFEFLVFAQGVWCWITI